MLRVLVDPQVVRLRPENGRTASGAAANAHARKQLKSRDDGHHHAPAADGLAAQPRPEETRESRVHEGDDAADASQTLDAREASASDSTRRPRGLRILRVALRRLSSCSGTPGGTSPSAAARDDPIEDDDATQHTT